MADPVAYDGLDRPAAVQIAKVLGESDARTALAPQARAAIWKQAPAAVRQPDDGGRHRRASTQ